MICLDAMMPTISMSHLAPFKELRDMEGLAAWPSTISHSGYSKFGPIDADEPQ